MPTTTNPTAALTEALRTSPDATAAALAEAAGIGRSTANKFLAAMEREGTASRIAGGHEGGRRAADRWSLFSTEPVPSPTESAEPNADDDNSADDGDANDSGANDEDEAAAKAPSTRLGKGALNTLVLDYLATNPGEHGPVAVAKALGNKSSGAVGNALARLEAAGKVRLTSTKPRRYEAVGA